MHRLKTIVVFGAGSIIFAVILSGCGLLSNPAPKMESTETTSNMPATKQFLERFSPAPQEIYELDELATTLFKATNGQDWANAAQSLAALKDTWQKISRTADEKNVALGNANLDKLAKNVAAQKNFEICRSLNKFMSIVSEIGGDYQLSPATDMINIGIAVREAGVYVKEENWEKAAAKSKALESAWNRSKPAMEQVGVLGELTKAHTLINQMKDAIDAENKDSFLGYLGEVNESLGKIRKFHYGK